MFYLLGEFVLVLLKLEGEEVFLILYLYIIMVKMLVNFFIFWQIVFNVDFKVLIGKEMIIEMELDGNGFDYVKGVGKGMCEIFGLVEKV